MKPQDSVPRLEEHAADKSHRLVRRFRAFIRELPPTFHLMALTVKWGRVPHDWELDFIAKMKGLQKSGIRFERVVRIALPRLFGEESEVLTSWIGKYEASNPERFVRSISKMWGSSAHSVIISLDRLTDERSLFEKKVSDPPYMSLLEAIQKSDAARSGVPDPKMPNGTPLETIADSEKLLVNPLALYRPTPILRRTLIGEGAHNDDLEKH